MTFNWFGARRRLESSHRGAPQGERARASALVSAPRGAPLADTELDEARMRLSELEALKVELVCQLFHGDPEVQAALLNALAKRFGSA